MSRVRTVLFLCTGNYFRSRFAEHLFNHLAAGRGLAVRALSAGLAPTCHTRNPGPLSPHTIQALEGRGIALPSPARGPADVTEDQFASCDLVVALKEAEHRPWMM